MDIVFNNPQFLWFMVAVPALVLLHFFSLKHAHKRAIKFANFEAMERATGETLIPKNMASLVLRVSILFLIVLSISGTTFSYQGRASDFDYALSIDASTSMLSDDMTPNRLEAAKSAAEIFVDEAPSQTNIGIVTFSGTPFIKSVLTSDKNKLEDILKNIEIESGGGTALGDAILTSASLLTVSDRDRIIILLTDGRSNTGMDIEDALGYADSKHISIHTIGIGTEAGGEFLGGAISTLDEETLKAISEQTGGKYFRATTVSELEDAYRSIISTNVKKLTIDLSPYLLLVGLVLMFLEWSLASTRFKIIP